MTDFFTVRDVKHLFVCFQEQDSDISEESDKGNGYEELSPQSMSGENRKRANSSPQLSLIIPQETGNEVEDREEIKEDKDESKKTTKLKEVSPREYQNKYKVTKKRSNGEEKKSSDKNNKGSGVRFGQKEEEQQKDKGGERREREEERNCIEQEYKADYSSGSSILSLDRYRISPETYIKLYRRMERDYDKEKIQREREREEGRRGRKHVRSKSMPRPLLHQAIDQENAEFHRFNDDSSSSSSSSSSNLISAFFKDYTNQALVQPLLTETPERYMAQFFLFNRASSNSINRIIGKREEKSLEKEKQREEQEAQRRGIAKTKGVAVRGQRLIARDDADLDKYRIHKPYGCRLNQTHPLSIPSYDALHGRSERALQESSNTHCDSRKTAGVVERDLSTHEDLFSSPRSRTQLKKTKSLPHEIEITLKYSSSFANELDFTADNRLRSEKRERGRAIRRSGQSRYTSLSLSLSLSLSQKLKLNQSPFSETLNRCTEVLFTIKEQKVVAKVREIDPPEESGEPEVCHVQTRSRGKIKSLTATRS